MDYLNKYIGLAGVVETKSNMKRLHDLLEQIRREKDAGAFENRPENR
jgi:hypothetical protein